MAASCRASIGADAATSASPEAPARPFLLPITLNIVFGDNRQVPGSRTRGRASIIQARRAATSGGDQYLHLAALKRAQGAQPGWLRASPCEASAVKPSAVRLHQSLIERCFAGFREHQYLAPLLTDCAKASG